MSDDGCGSVVGVMVLCSISFLAGMKAGYVIRESLSESAVRQEALDAGAAHWQIDAKTGEKTFVWEGDD